MKTWRNTSHLGCEQVVMATSSPHLPGEGDPADLLTEHQTRRRQQLSKVIDIDSLLLVPLELNAGLRQHVDGVLGIHILPGGEEEREGEEGGGWEGEGVRGEEGRGDGVKGEEVMV